MGERVRCVRIGQRVAKQPKQPGGIRHFAGEVYAEHPTFGGHPHEPRARESVFGYPPIVDAQGIGRAGTSSPKAGPSTRKAKRRAGRRREKQTDLKCLAPPASAGPLGVARRDHARLNPTGTRPCPTRRSTRASRIATNTMISRAAGRSMSNRRRAGLAGAGEDRRPRVEEDDFDVEDQEDHRDDVEADVEPLAGVADRHHAALVRRLLARAGAARADQERDDDVADGEADARSRSAARPAPTPSAGLGAVPAAEAACCASRIGVTIRIDLCRRSVRRRGRKQRARSPTAGVGNQPRFSPSTPTPSPAAGRTKGNDHRRQNHEAAAHQDKRRRAHRKML